MGGAEAVIHALMDVLTPSGKLVMPAQSPQLSDPAHWENPLRLFGMREAVDFAVDWFSLRRSS